ncbi:unnamed protein product [Durusdinium trenchii]|uniref:Uncharacterized protein n=1 Tax=Durusdinium trenchii TaxID=1381693 RepID=A0ABP0JKJ7_9DINO
MPSDPIGGLYRKIVIGKEQSHRTSFMTGHLLWQDRLRIEKGQRDKHLVHWYKKLGREPLDFAGEQGSQAGTRIARDRLLWQDSEGPGSRSLDLDTGRIGRRGRQKIAQMRAPEQDTGESRPIGELPLLHHEVSHRLAKGEDMKSLGHPLGCYGDVIQSSAATVPLRNVEVITKQCRAQRGE